MIDVVYTEYCSRCRKYFVNKVSLEEHKRNSSAHWFCCKCNKDFASRIALEQHYVQSARRHYCQPCRLEFPTADGLTAHRDHAHYYCFEHGKYFDTSEGLRQHYMQSSDHPYCPFCDTLFESNEALLDHGDLQHHICWECTTFFETEDKLMDHNDYMHYFCRSCNRLFTTAADLQSHLNSKIHAPRSIKCPGRGCGRAFVSVSALILHAESGTCPSGVTRAQVDSLVVRLDRQNIITNPARMIRGPDGTVPEEPKYWATDRSWNGRAYECFLCKTEFKTLPALDSHLKSPRHRARIYHCPQAGCGMEFRVLSALSQHVESDSCGVRANRQVQDIMDRLAQKFYMIEV